RALGYSMTGHTGARKLFIAEGEGANGKSTLFNLVADVLGDYGWNAPGAMLLAKRGDDGPRNDVAALLGKRFVIASETGEGKRLDETLVKRLTGGDKVTARYLYKEWFEFYPSAKYWWFTNHLPDVRGGDHAIWDRLVRIPFRVRIPESEWIADYHRVLFNAEAAGILAWLVAGCLAWRRNGLQRPAAIQEATAAYRREQDLLAPFLEERCVIDPMARVEKPTLYAAYTAWTDAQHERTLSHKKFSERLLADPKKRFTDGPRTNKARCWTGLRLRSDEDPTPIDEVPRDHNESGNAVIKLNTGAPDATVDDSVTDRDRSQDGISNLSRVKTGVCTPIVTDVTDVTDFEDKSLSRAHAHRGVTEPPVTSVTSVTSNPETASAFASGIIRITTNDALAQVLPDLFAADVLGLDFETTGLDPRSDSLQLVQLATRDRVYLIDPATVDLAALAPLLTTSSSTIVGHNLGFDLGFLHAAGLSIPSGDRIFDTVLASQLIDGGAHPSGAKTADPSDATGRGKKPTMVGYHSLAAVAHRWLGQVIDKTLQVSDWSGPLSDEHIAYAARDAAILLPLRDALDVALAQGGLANVAALEFAALPAVIWLEATGTPVDVAAWSALRDEAAATLAALDAELATVLPCVNVDSPTQLIAALAGLGIAIPNGQEATLRTVVDQHPAVDLVVRRKDAKKRVSTYGDTYLNHVHPTTGRIHANYRLIGAASGRMACSKPNLQNIPREPAYRRCICPSPGRVLIKADYSQIELRIAAQISGDSAMQAAFRAGEDLHTKTARAVLDREPTAEDRQLAKALNFGLLYGMGAERLRAYARDEYGVTLSANEAEQFRQRFFQAYPGLRAWHRAQQEGEVTTYTLIGRPRHGVSQFAEKLNSPVQGTGADILKGAMARLWADRAVVPSAVPVLVVHDEIVCEVDRGEADACATWLTAHMEAAGAAVLTEVPVVVETQIVADW
ncbi:MAG: hypothetical protein H0T18_07680, partial [Chloroflexia bacterium]|nr:hypothetical protein [Chloroflexia bacterium]